LNELAICDPTGDQEKMKSNNRRLRRVEKA
jgi:hypothetical protein